MLRSVTGSWEIMTTTDVLPKPSTSLQPTIDLNITWLIQHIDNSHKTCFGIDRKNKNCFTPRRNSDVEGALFFFRSIYMWGNKISQYFHHNVFSVASGHGLDLSMINPDSVFVPVLPFLENGSEDHPQSHIKHGFVILINKYSYH